MRAKLRLVSGVAVGVFLLFGVPIRPAPPAVLIAWQASPQTSDLDRALRANDLVKARQLVPVNWAGSEQLFVSYLEGAFLGSADAGARTQAGRLGEVFFRIVEYDFARAIVQDLDTADAARRQQLIGVVRDYFTTLEALRGYLAPDSLSSRAEAQRIRAEFIAVADRFRALSFPRGQLHALRSGLNVSIASADADAVASALGDDLSIVRNMPRTEASLAMAARLGLPRLQCSVIQTLVSPLVNSTDPTKLEQATKYLERARALSRSIPSLESVNYWQFSAVAPNPATTTLPDLWNVYFRLKRPADAQSPLAEAIEISRPFGERAELAALSAFGSRAARLGAEATAALLQAARSLGPKAELQTMKSISFSDMVFRTESAEKALALAMAMADPHERAVTLEWYSRARNSSAFQMAMNPGGFTPAQLADVFKTPLPESYTQLLQLCLKSDEVDLTVDALASQGSFQVWAGDMVPATAAFTQAVELAERSANFKKAAQVANRAVQSRLPVSQRKEFAGRAIAAATRADEPGELSKALRVRAMMGVGASNESFRDLQDALLAAERYTTRSGDPTEEVSCLRALASEHAIRGEYQAAIEVLGRVAAKREGFASVLDESAIHQEMARIYSTYLGEPVLALAAAERARQIIDLRTPAPSRPDDQPSMTVRGANYSLARLYQDIGQPMPALEAYARALSGFSGTPNWLPNQRTWLMARARYLTQLGDYEAALQDWDAVLPIMKATENSSFGSQAFQAAVWCGNVARVHALAGNREQALALAREAIDELNRDTSDAWIGIDVIDSVIGILLNANAPDEAIAFCNRYFKKVLARPAAQPGVEKAFLEAVARAEVKAGRFEAARSKLLAVVDIDRNHPTAEIGGLGGSLLALGNLEIKAANNAKANEYLVAAREAANPYNVSQIWQIERALALVLGRGGDVPAAEAHYDSALTALESMHEHLRPEEFRTRYGEERDRVYEEYAGLLAAQALASGRAADAARAFQAAERKRTQTLWNLLATGWSRIPPDAMPDQLKRIVEMEARLGAKQARLQEQFGLPADKRNTKMVETLQREQKQLQDDHAGLLTAVAQGQYRYAAPAKLASSLAEPVEAAIEPSRVMVEYLVTDQCSYAFVVSRAGVKVVPLSVGRARLREQVQRLLAPFRRLRAGDVDLARLEYDTRTAHLLYQAIFAPVRPLLGAVSDVVIVPDDVLNFLPFDALVEKAPERAARGQVLHAEFADQPFLLRRYAISYLTSAAQLLSRALSGGSSQAPRTLFAMANPAAGRVAPAPAQDDPLKRQLRSAAFGAYLAPLPGAEAEVQGIAKYFPREAFTIVVGARATEAAYKSQAGQHAIVHFATHAVASDGQPLYSTLVLAPDSAAGDDGFLQAYEVLRTPLRAELVVLSGCETALGSEDSGQGLVGLVAAFDQAGARSVLATLWSIDESTSQMMTAFYGAMAQGHSTAVALRQAKLQLLRQRVRMGKTELSLAHPFFWAPFILVGAPTKPVLR